MVAAAEITVSDPTRQPRSVSRCRTCEAAAAGSRARIHREEHLPATEITLTAARTRDAGRV
jgi:hypothetical protein